VIVFVGRKNVEGAGLGKQPFKTFKPFNRYARFKTFAQQRTREELPRFENSRNVDALRSRGGILTDFDLNS